MDKLYEQNHTFTNILPDIVNVCLIIDNYLFDQLNYHSIVIQWKVTHIVIYKPAILSIHTTRTNSSCPLPELSMKLHNTGIPDGSKQQANQWYPNFQQGLYPRASSVDNIT